GNALEMSEAIRVLHGEKGALRDLTLSLASECLRLIGQDDKRLEQRLGRSAASEAFVRMIAAQCGPCDLLDRSDVYLTAAPVIRPVMADAGAVSAIDVTALGHAVVALGGGRVRAGEKIDHRVGLSALAKLGEAVGPDAPVAMVHAAD